jgi:uncharacterized protein YjbJ (UPF0337 family)
LKAKAAEGRAGECMVGTPDALGADEARDPIARSRELTRILRKREIPMGEIIDKTKGKIKQVAGTLAGKDKLKADGEVDELKGSAKGAVEDVKHAAKGAAK